MGREKLYQRNILLKYISLTFLPYFCLPCNDKLLHMYTHTQTTNLELNLGQYMYARLYFHKSYFKSTAANFQNPI